MRTKALPNIHANTVKIKRKQRRTGMSASKHTHAQTGREMNAITT